MKEEDNDDDANHGNPENYTVRLCDWIRSLSLHEVPLEVQVRAKHLILDGVACALAGARLPWSLTACETVLTIESPGPCAIIGHEKVSQFKHEDKTLPETQPPMAEKEFFLERWSAGRRIAQQRLHSRLRARRLS